LTIANKLQGPGAKPRRQEAVEARRVAAALKMSEKNAACLCFCEAR
jgi:hypothetical protein